MSVNKRQRESPARLAGLLFTGGRRYLAACGFQVGVDLGENLQDLARPGQRIELVRTAGGILQQRGTQRSVSIHLDLLDAMLGALALVDAMLGALALVSVCRAGRSSGRFGR